MNQTMRLRRALAILLALGLMAALALSFACGGGDDADSDGTATAAATTPAATGNGGDGGDVTFDVSMTDNPNAFTPTEFRVPTGAEVMFNLTNDGTAIHNMRVAGEDDAYNTADDAVSDPDLMSGGQTGTLEWTAPDQAGEYKLQCDIHPTDMKGTITVE